MVTRGINLSLNAKLQKAYGNRVNKRERRAATSSFKIEKLRSTTNNDELLTWQISTKEETSTKTN